MLLIFKIIKLAESFYNIIIIFLSNRKILLSENKIFFIF